MAELKSSIEQKEKLFLEADRVKLSLEQLLNHCRFKLFITRMGITAGIEFDNYWVFRDNESKQDE